MSILLLLATLHDILQAPINQAAQQSADHAIDLALIGGVVSVLVALIGAWGLAKQNGRINRSNERAKDAKDTVEAMQETILSMAKEVSLLREAAKRRAAADRQKEAAQRRWRLQMEAHVKEQDVRISELETYISQVDGVLSSASDDTTIGVLRPQLPVKPSMRRSLKKEQEEG